MTFCASQVLRSALEEKLGLRLFNSEHEEVVVDTSTAPEVWARRYPNPLMTLKIGDAAHPLVCNLQSGHLDPNGESRRCSPSNRR
jgi:hypothetical protein